MGSIRKQDAFASDYSALFDGVPDTVCKVIEHYWQQFEDVFAHGEEMHLFTLVHLDKGSSSVGRIWFVLPGGDRIVAEYDESLVDPVEYQKYKESLEFSFSNSKRLIFSNSWGLRS